MSRDVVALSCSLIALSMVFLGLIGLAKLVINVRSELKAMNADIISLKAEVTELRDALSVHHDFLIQHNKDDLYYRRDSEEGE